MLPSQQNNVKIVSKTVYNVNETHDYSIGENPICADEMNQSGLLNIELSENPSIYLLT